MPKKPATNTSDKTNTPVADELEPDISLLERLLDSENHENIYLFNEEGDEVELEQIAVINRKGEIFAILRPLTAAEDEAVVFKIATTDEESITVVEDEKLADEILDLYHKQAGIE